LQRVSDRQEPMGGRHGEDFVVVVMARHVLWCVEVWSEKAKAGVRP